MVSPGPDQPQLDFELVSEGPIPPGVGERKLMDLATAILAAEGATGSWQITVALVSDARLQALHRDYMGSDSPTDIMTFPLDQETGDSPGGDLVISLDHALTQAAAWQHTPAEEVEFLVAHGLLHLLGWRDEDEEQRAQMLLRQRQLIEGWKNR